MLVVQHEAIPQAILGTDVVCQAKSGMGKTAVFVIAILQQDSEPKHTSSLILCHTRELAYQICHEFDRFRKYLPQIKTAVFFGGIPVQTHRDMLREQQPHIVIGTPGRILQLATEGNLILKHVKHFVLDECDKMLDSLGMRRDIQSIFKMTPHDKQVMMFSATMPPETREIARKFMHNPLEIYIDDGAKLTLEGLQQYYIQLNEQEKNRKLVDLLDALEFNQCIIFVRSVARASELNKLLVECNFPSICIHSQMGQEERIARYRRFKDFQARIMVSTNLFGRGVDIPRVNVVINYDMPSDPDAYLHRVGRAGRFGTKGLSISFISSPDDCTVLNDVQKRFVVEVPELPDEIDAASYMGS
eukprot:TRINITY_DN515_c0_g1_i1.p2 TRINITY_DN515_c0_g1~~TRINITY_DN515_c0_g1_i1.p2  ORF type:complete len:359 (+),score=106.78 TRINITY_DN515_c0_g1_i1:617-1693(+)